jgi:Zn finger protein HypA/HybF involved in hydrogenase expression
MRPSILVNLLAEVQNQLFYCLALSKNAVETKNTRRCPTCTSSRSKMSYQLLVLLSH